MLASGNDIHVNSEKFKFFNHQEKTINYNEIECEKKFMFKELNDKNEFLQMFALRYLVYRYVNFIEPNKDQLDIDCFDLYSTFLGVFEVTGETKRLIGTVRIISGDKKSPYEEVVKELFDNMCNHKLSYLLNRPTLFSIMQTFDIPEEYLTAFHVDKNKHQINSLEKNSKPFEISRLAILPEYWGSKAKIETGLHDLIILDSWKSNPKKNIYIIATHPRTRRKYEKLGFRIIPGTKELLYKSLKQLAIAMVMNLENYLNTPNPYGERCKSLFKSFLEKGYFLRNPTF